MKIVKNTTYNKAYLTPALHVSFRIFLRKTSDTLGTLDVIGDSRYEMKQEGKI